jgi:hypothetical protein
VGGGGSTSSGSVGRGGGTISGSAGGGGFTSSGSAAGVVAPSRARWAGATAHPPSPASWMAHLTPCMRLRKKKLLDSLLDDRRWWCWGFLGAVVDEVFGRSGVILTRRRTVRRPVMRLGIRVHSGELLATKRVMWSQSDGDFIFGSKYQMSNYSYELFDS